MVNRRRFFERSGIIIGAGLVASTGLLTKSKEKTEKKQSFQFHQYQNKSRLDKSKLPQPVFDKEPGFIELYWNAWEHAWNHVLHQKSVPQSPYMDEAFWGDTIWIWDTCFMALFCKYAPDVFPGIESLDNFYSIMHDDAETGLFIQHPDNPPLFAWTEWEYYKFTADKKRIQRILKEKKYLQKHFDFFENREENREYPYCGRNAYPVIKRLEKGYLWSGRSSGMDNTPRGYRVFDNMLWVDALAQQALAAKYIARLAREIGEDSTVHEYTKIYTNKTKLLNQCYWNSADEFYYDIRADQPNIHYKIKTPASYWPMLAEMCTREQAEAMAAYAANPDVFGGAIPWPSVARNCEFFEPKGNYMRGSIIVPLAYMSVKALEKYNKYQIADISAANLLNHMYKTYTNYKPNTIWECYNPKQPLPATTKDNIGRVRPHFCGWSALGPIALFIENVLGFHTVNAVNKTVNWRLYQQEKHGIKNLSFGNIQTDIIFDGKNVSVRSNDHYTLYINNRKCEIKPGEQKINIET